ncbi:putative tetratricopeptide repeat protein 12 [Apostichopus japonicus]|uniref:Putative tetratricopeptide repeat protein 12 n=1 Tax=Stichopus japonicus TaxID=307972 RepID=A0A2G8KCS4_STIJA|nr:putative tetratricopeptide repeat protein 12 [Apostichopus japonicus]
MFLLTLETSFPRLFGQFNCTFSASVKVSFLIAEMDDNHEKEDMEEFLRKVDRLEAIVNGEESEEDLKEKEGVNRTVINKDAFKNEPTSASGAKTVTNQEGFLKSIEADAAERAARRKTKTKMATKLKEEGNVAFKEGDYETAVRLYSEGLTHLKDMLVLYTNRAQAYLHLQKYTEAIADCETALLLDPTFTKAFVHKGRALVAQKQYDQAILIFSEIIKHNPKQEKIAKDYIRQAQQAKDTNTAESKAQKLFLEGDDHANNMVDVLEKIRTEGKPTVYYSGGLAVLADMLKDDVSRTLFRTNKGLDIFTENRTVSGAITKIIKGSKGVVELELVMSSIDLLDRCLLENDENLRYLLKFPGIPEIIYGLLGCSSESTANKCVTLLLKISYRPSGLAEMLANLDMQRLLVLLLKFVQSRNVGTAECTKLINNLSTADKFTHHFREGMEEEFLPAFEELLTSPLSDSILSSCTSFMGNMARDSVIRKKLNKRMKLIDALSGLLEHHGKNLTNPNSQDVLLSALALLINVTMDTNLSTDQSESIATKLIPLFVGEDRELVERSLTLYGRLIPQSPSVIIVSAIEHNIPDKLLGFIRDENCNLHKASIKVLALLTQGSKEVRKQIVASKKDFKRICSLLDRADDTTVANTALCLSHCFDVDGASSVLEETDIVRALLEKTDTSNSTIKQNSAIALAKLAMGNQRHLERLRDLGGIGILHSCMKHVK